MAGSKSSRDVCGIRQIASQPCGSDNHIEAYGRATCRAEPSVGDAEDQSRPGVSDSPFATRVATNQIIEVRAKIGSFFSRIATERVRQAQLVVSFLNIVHSSRRLNSTRFALRAEVDNWQRAAAQRGAPTASDGRACRIGRASHVLSWCWR